MEKVVEMPAWDVIEAAMKNDVAIAEKEPEGAAVARIGERMRRQNPTSLSHWFPLLEAAGIPVPKTILLDMPDEAQAVIWRAFYGEEAGSSALEDFGNTVRAACAEVGYPAFLRTDHTSGKHGWKRNCFVSSPDSVLSNVFGVAEFSEHHMMPWARWAVREFLPTIPLGVCPHYGDMPVCREFRFFAEAGKIKCWHPYWPLHALEDGGATGIDFDVMCRVENEDELLSLAKAASLAVPGAWSIDILETRRGWFVTDMAEAHKSWHWEDCTA